MTPSNETGLLARITQPDNLASAWRKARGQFASGDMWSDDWIVADFESNLDRELLRLAEELADGGYTTSALKPMGQPKKASGNDRPVRQVFWVPVRDQVAWLAVANVIGRIFEDAMPIWSYGNRLHRAVWYDEQRQLQFGPHRGTSRAIYRPFRQSWPLYRRHIALTVRAMGRLIHRPEDPAEDHTLSLEENRPLADPDRIPYLLPDFWGNSPAEVFRAHIDLQKFYPRVNLDHVRANFLQILPNDPDLLLLLDALLRFHVDFSGVPDGAVEHLGLRECKHARGIYTGIPTGLFVGGLLANIAMLDIDERAKELNAQRRVAHFRYVDDHTFLATTPESLLEWTRATWICFHKLG